MTKGEELVERLRVIVRWLMRSRLPGREATSLDAASSVNEAIDALSSAQERIAELEGALTPSADTKAAYEGEFYMNVVLRTRHEEEVRSVQIPWVNIKEIMAAIRRRSRTMEKMDG